MTEPVTAGNATCWFRCFPPRRTWWQRLTFRRSRRPAIHTTYLHADGTPTQGRITLWTHGGPTEDATAELDSKGRVRFWASEECSALYATDGPQCGLEAGHDETHRATGFFDGQPWGWSWNWTEPSTPTWMDFDESGPL